MDAEESQDGGKPSAKVIPFATSSAPPDSEPSKETSFEDYLDAIAAAVEGSVYSKTAQADREALENEYTFHRRFGFTVNRDRRAKVLEFKHAEDVTDREIRHLWRTTNLDLNGQHARITSSIFAEVWGYVLIGMMCLLMLWAFWAALRIGQPTWKHLVALTVTELVLVGFLSLADWMYVRPNQIRRRIARDKKN